MIRSKANSIISQARESGVLSVSELDAVLEDSQFEKNVSALMRLLEHVSVVGESGAKTEAPAEPLDDSRAMMTRDDEIRLAKRLEFFKRRLTRATMGNALPRPLKERLRRLETDAGRARERVLPAFCKELKQGGRGKGATIRRWWTLYDQTRRLFIKKSMYMVAPLTIRYVSYGIPLPDLNQEGNTALIRAVERFDWRKGVRLQTYAAFWIRQAVERFISANKRIVRVPNYMQQRMRKYRRETSAPADGFAPAVDDFSGALHVPPRVAGQLLEIEQKPISIDAMDNGHETVSFESALTAPAHDEVLRETDRKELQNSLSYVLGVLSQKERYVLANRFGLDGVPVKSLDEIGNRIGLSRERIRQIQLRAIKRLRVHPIAERLRPFYA